MKKKVLVSLLAASMVMGLAACGSEAADTTGDAGTAAEDTADADADAPADDAASGELIKVGIINNDPNESGYRTANDRDLQATFCEANGYDASFAYGKTNQEQIEAAQQFIQDGVDYLLLSAADTSGWDTVLQDAKDNGIYVLLFDRTIDASEDLYDASVVSDMAKEGETAASWLASTGLDEYNIIHIQGQIGSAAQIGRTAALDKLVNENDNWSYVVQQTGNWSADEAKAIVEAAINSGDKFNVIYCENDDEADGAIAALDAAGITHGKDGDVIVMGFDCQSDNLQNLVDGTQNYDGQCNPFQASYLEEVIKQIQSGSAPAEKTIIMDEKGFNCDEISADDVTNYGI